LDPHSTCFQLEPPAFADLLHRPHLVRMLDLSLPQWRKNQIQPPEIQKPSPWQTPRRATAFWAMFDCFKLGDRNRREMLIAEGPLASKPLSDSLSRIDLQNRLRLLRCGSYPGQATFVPTITNNTYPISIMQANFLHAIRFFSGACLRVINAGPQLKTQGLSSLRR
jgi:hypothetical protein